MIVVLTLGAEIIYDRRDTSVGVACEVLDFGFDVLDDFFSFW